VSLEQTSLSKVCTLSAFSVCLSIIFGASSLFRPSQDVPQSANVPLVLAIPNTEPPSQPSVSVTDQAGGEMATPSPWRHVSVPDRSGLIADLMAVPQQIGMTTNNADHLSSPAPSPQQALFAGVWAPDPSSCSLQSFRDGLLPTVINVEGASAGDTFCSFRNQQEMQTGWRMDALCSNKQQRWSARVHLSVNGDRLTWKSQRGSQSYTRCMSDLRVAQAH
jgi:hypothetical protein